MMDAQEARDRVVEIRREMGRLIEELGFIVEQHLPQDQAYYEAYLTRQLEENVMKANPYNTDIGDLVAALNKLVTGHDEDCECPQCLEGVE
jgi:hypothetical protein